MQRACLNQSAVTVDTCAVHVCVLTVLSPTVGRALVSWFTTIVPAVISLMADIMPCWQAEGNVIIIARQMYTWSTVWMARWMGNLISYPLCGRIQLATYVKMHKLIIIRSWKGKKTSDYKWSLFCILSNNISMTITTSFNINMLPDLGKPDQRGYLWVRQPLSPPTPEEKAASCDQCHPKSIPLCSG